MARSWDQGDFPNLVDGTYVCTSQLDTRYNCIAWAANDKKHWWEPTVHQDGVRIFWPPYATWDTTVEAYAEAFAWFGYVLWSNDGSLEPGWEKIALYGTIENGRREAQHAARQLPDGRWTSKLGPDYAVASAKAEE